MSEVSAYVRRYRRVDVYAKERYRDMVKRVNGKPDGGGKNCPWLGMPVCDKDEFLQFALSHPEYLRLHRQWEENDFLRRFSPTVHRINRKVGYLLDNITFVVHGEKSRNHLEDGRKTNRKKKRDRAAIT
jgi:hypothetical protein